MLRKNEETPLNGNLLIVGTTASGKSSLAIELARRRPNIEIISIDSMAIYKGMDIGTGKDLNEYCLNGHSIPYHLIDIIKPSEDYSVYSFQKQFHLIYNNILNSYI